MFCIGDLVVYEGMGVCRVAEIAPHDFSSAKERLYYTLEPVNQSGSIFVPVDADVFMRSVISKDEADRLIDGMPSIEAEVDHTRALQELTQHYTEALRSHDCADLIALAMSIYAKKRYREAHNQKFGVVDESFIKRAENLLYGEFSVALGIPPEQVPAYIAARLGTSPSAPRQA